MSTITKKILIYQENKELKEMIEGYKAAIESYEETPPKNDTRSNSLNPTIDVKKYSLNDNRYENIMSHMDILWCDSEGWDGCSKCTGYRDIIMSALDKIEGMSSRRIDQDFATKHKSGDPKYNVKDNTNAVTILGGGDKDEDEYVSNCMAKREYRS